MKYIIRAVEWRMHYVEEILKQIPEAIVVKDNNKSAGDTLARALAEAGDESAMYLEDDIILCDDFKEKTQQYIDDMPDSVINFFSGTRKADIEIGSRFEGGGGFMRAQCFYIPAGMSKKILEYRPGYAKRMLETCPLNYNGCDTLIRDYLVDNKLKYFRRVPSLVDHIVGKSAIDPKRNPNRPSKNFVK